MNLKGSVTGIFSVITLCVAATVQAADMGKFVQIAHKTMDTVKSGSISNNDADALIKMQEELISIGKQAIKEYSTKHPKTAKMLDLVYDKADTMASLTLPEIEEQWHEKGYLKSKGIRTDALEEKSVTGSLMDTIVHPATAIIALRDYKKSKDAKLLQQVNDELEEVVHHVELIK